MLPTIHNILFATDLSENARYAYTWAASLAQRYGGRITIVYVIEKLSAETILQVRRPSGEATWQGAQEEQRADVMARIRGRLGSFCDEISSKVDACTFQVDKIVVSEGVAADEILQQAELTDADLIVIGARGLGTFKAALMGATARRVVRSSSRPVMVVRLPQKGSVHFDQQGQRTIPV